ncbi:MAG: bifunctional phosphopantothenoylcysteine decarboxylase/phosphopantothenate--cysteine ligase CoaBC [Bacillota bacterium]|nr:bifunctional phosphopantothenoylcysteine decarboxylase/phosphopantothenate--cysteine ligase CoaBC [Bacillota bacterium]
MSDPRGWIDKMDGQKTVILGVTGCIAAYRAADIAGALKKNGIAVHVVMTKNAQKFITPRTLEAISQNPVTCDLFERDKPWEVGHVSLAKAADAVLIAPCTANILGKIAHGIADDMLTTTVMATKAPIIIAPAMNTRMYENPIVQQNIEKLESMGCRFVGPVSGRLACGDVGLGHIADTDDIAKAVLSVLDVKKDLAGLKILVTAGPTCEPIDPVRYIANRSSGKMGYAIAQAALERGGEVILVSGPVHIPPPRGARMVSVETAEQMRDAVLGEYENADIVIMAAAVADFMPESADGSKIKKADTGLEIKLKKTPDILIELGKRKKNQILIGFAAETDNLEEYAKQKLIDKNLDMVAANDVSLPGAGFGCDTNIVTCFLKNGEKIALDLAPKIKIAHSILDQAARLRGNV